MRNLIRKMSVLSQRWTGDKDLIPYLVMGMLVNGISVILIIQLLRFFGWYLG
jgi:hypothetical protein